MPTETYDCVVIGGGPAGATTATLVAKAGHSVCLLDKDQHPRFHVGESLMPDSYWTFEKMGFLPKMQASHFVKKYSVQFVSSSGRETAPFYFFQANNHPSSMTWQVVRSDFDAMLVEHAAQCGATVHQRHVATDVLFEGDRAVGVKVRRQDAHSEGSPTPPNGGDREIRARVVVDASGQSSLIARKLGLKRIESRLRNGSVFAHYKNARRDSGIDEGATLVIYTRDGRGWFWYIPLPDNIVSVGVVRPAEELFAEKGRSPAEVLDDQIAQCPPLVERLTHGWRCSDVHVLRDFSYRSTRCAGEGWTLVGDAFGFLDPIYSSGVFLALKSGEFASECINTALATGDTSGQTLGAWGPRLLSGMEAIRKIVYAFYTEGFSFGAFRRRHPQYNSHVTSLLIGDVFRPEVHEVFGPLGEMVPLPEPGLLEAANTPLVGLTGSGGASRLAVAAAAPTWA